MGRREGGEDVVDIVAEERAVVEAEAEAEAAAGGEEGRGFVDESSAPVSSQLASRLLAVSIRKLEADNNDISV